MGHRDPAVLDRAKELSDGVDVQVCLVILSLERHRIDRADLIHIDVCGPMANVTPEDCRYILTLTYDFSYYCFGSYVGKSRM